MKNKIQLSKYTACICEGSAECAIMDILLDNDLLIFNRYDLIDDKVLRCRNAAEFERNYLRKGYKDGKVSILRVLDSRRENYKLSKAYVEKVDVINIVTAPEIEMLYIHSQGKYDEYIRSKKKPSDFCKQDLRIKNIKSYDYVKEYFSNVNLLLQAIKLYNQKANIPNGEYSLNDILKNPQ